MLFHWVCAVRSAELILVLMRAFVSCLCASITSIFFYVCAARCRRRRNWRCEAEAYKFAAQPLVKRRPWMHPSTRATQAENTILGRANTICLGFVSTIS